MKKVMILGLTTLSLVVFPHVVAAQEKETVVATAGDIKPFSYENGGKLTGYDIEVLKAADKYMTNYRFSFKKTAWESIFVGLDSGHYQVAANNLSYTEARATKYRYSLPIAANPLVLVVPEGSDIKSLDDIGGRTTQDDTGTSTAKLVENWNKEHSSQPSKITYSGEDVSKRLLDLENEEFDYLIFDKISVETIIKQKNLDLKVLKLDLSANPNNYIIFSSDSGKLQKEFDKALKKLYQTGRLKKLSQKYLGGSYLPSKKELGLN